MSPQRGGAEGRRKRGECTALMTSAGELRVGLLTSQPYALDNCLDEIRLTPSPNLRLPQILRVFPPPPRVSASKLTASTVVRLLGNARPP